VSRSKSTRDVRARAGQISVKRLKSAAGVSSGRIERAVRLAAGDRTIRSINVTLADDDTLASLHDRYLADPRPTDVLSFDLRDDPLVSPLSKGGPGGDEHIEGEIVVSVDAGRREAGRRGIPVGHEVLRYIVHGILHLRGYDDRTPAQRRRMKREEDRVLRRLYDADASR